MTFTDLSELQQQTIQTIAIERVGMPFAASPVGGGRNSRIYCLEGDNHSHIAIKVYFRQPGDSRDRLGTEFGALQFMWQNGIRDIPQPFAIYPEAGIGVYEFIEGNRILPVEIGTHEIDAAVDFTGRLKMLAAHAYPQANSLNPASEAFFSIEKVYQNVQNRLNRLLEGQREDPDAALEEFLQHDLIPTLERVIQWSRARTAWEQEIPLGQRTLSPSDFGFHNAIRRDRIVFLDFEYFGWDDPSKLISDFILHPAMNLNADLARRFVNGVAKHFDMVLRTRVESTYPLFGLKWGLICLNEFLPEHRRRRQFAAANVQDWDQIKAQQLSKARQIILRINREYEQFPYFD